MGARGGGDAEVYVVGQVFLDRLVYTIPGQNLSRRWTAVVGA